jgi:hypothetical protein
MKTTGIIFALIFVLLLPVPVQAQDDVQSLNLLIRDGQGTPLAGVSLSLLRTGPPHEPLDACVTDSVGQCMFWLPPGAYLVRFNGELTGLPFQAPDAQNGGMLDDAGAAGGGFGIYLEPSQADTLVTFVVGRQGETLVPLWDLSRDANALPEPFALPDNPFETGGDPLEGIDLSPIDEDIQINEPTVGNDEITTPAVTITPESKPGSDQPDSLSLGLLGLVMAGCLLTGLGFLLRTIKRRREREAAAIQKRLEEWK